MISKFLNFWHADLIRPLRSARAVGSEHLSLHTRSLGSVGSARSTHSCQSLGSLRSSCFALLSLLSARAADTRLARPAWISSSPGLSSASQITIAIPTLVFIIGFFAGAAADAAIPSSRTIAGRLVKNSGSGIYSIEQEVQFRTTSSELLTLRERWIIENGEKMRLIVTGPATGRSPSRFDVVYHEGKRTAPDLQGSLRTTPIGPEFIEVFSHVRSSKTFLDALVRSGIVPASFLRERQRFAANSPRYIPEPRVRLGRTSGVVNYVFGEATAVDAKKQNPGVWIEQDAFLLRRLRFPSEAELTADGFTLFPKGLRLARERTLSWGSHFASIRVLSAKSLTAEESQKLLSPESLTSADAQAARLPDEAQVKEFYLRFR